MTAVFGTVYSWISQDLRFRFLSQWNHICHPMPERILTKYILNLKPILPCLLSLIYTLLKLSTPQKQTFSRFTNTFTHTHARTHALLQQLWSPPAKLNYFSSFQSINMSSHQTHTCTFLLSFLTLHYPPANPPQPQVNCIEELQLSLR